MKVLPLHANEINGALSNELTKRREHFRGKIQPATNAQCGALAYREVLESNRGKEGERDRESSDRLHTLRWKWVYPAEKNGMKISPFACRVA